jgi:SulP family sulfate permease
LNGRLTAREWACAAAGETGLLRRRSWRFGVVPPQPAHHRGIFRQGDPGTALFLVTRGRASVQISQAGTTIRLVTFVPGTVFGELAILDGGPRAATIVADEAVVAHSLGSHAFAELREKEPAAAIKLLAALGRELSFRLRSANLTIQQLEM